MARPLKKGLSYFPLDVDFLQDVKVRKIIRGCGISATPILIALLSSCYRDEGYYMRWDDDEAFLIADLVGVSDGVVVETVRKAVQVDFFDPNMFEQYSILTSRGIQSRFLEATSRRKDVEIDGRFLLLNINVDNNSVNVDNNSINVSSNEQSKVNKIKVNKSRVKNSIAKIALYFETHKFGIVSPYIMESMTSYLEEYSEEWIVQAMNIANENNARNWKYVEAILNDWGNRYTAEEKPWEMSYVKGNRKHNKQRWDGSGIDWDAESKKHNR